jgi:hypothetical protein
MAQADFNVANQSFPAARADLNNQLLALATNSSGASAPSTTYPYMQWADTTGGIMYLRNAANSGWSSLRTLDGNTVYATYFRQRVDSSFLALTGGLTGGANIELYGSTHGNANIAVYDATTHTFRSVDGLTQYGQFNASSFDVGAPGTSAAIINVGAGATGNRYAYIDLIGDTTYSDYGLRIIRNNTGANTTSALQHRGAGTLFLDAQDGGSIVLATSGVNRLTVDGATGLTTANNGISGTISRGAVATPTGVSVDFTSIPSWVKKIQIVFDSISTNGTSNIIVQLGDSGGIETTGYASNLAYAINASATVGTISNAGYVAAAVTASTTHDGIMTLVNISGNKWIAAHTVSQTSTGGVAACGGGSKTLSATLDRVRITTANGTDVFDAGTINITWAG